MSHPGPATTLCVAGLVAMAAAASAPVASPPWKPHIEGPPPAHTGGFGEPTCAACHLGAPLNEPGSTLEVLGLGGGYRPGQFHTVTVRLGSFDMLSAGFQASFRFAAGERRGTGAGRIRPFDDRVAVVRAAEGAEGGAEYVQHTRAGASVSGAVAEWTFEWRAPEGAGPVALHVAANSGSGDNSPLDDLVYTLSLSLTPAAAEPAGERESR